MCSRLTLAIFDGEEKLETVNQLSTDNGFGTAYVSLDEGEYRLVVIAHNGKGNCTVSAPEKVKFASNKLTDTFYYYGRLSVTADGATSDINLRRAVGAFKLHITDETIPEEIRSPLAGSECRPYLSCCKSQKPQALHTHSISLQATRNISKRLSSFSTTVERHLSNRNIHRVTNQY